MSGRGGGQGREGGGRRGGHFGDGRGTDGGRGEWDAGGVGALIMIGSGGRRDMEGWFPEIGSGVINTAKLLLHVSIFLSGVGKAISPRHACPPICGPVCLPRCADDPPPLPVVRHRRGAAAGGAETPGRERVAGSAGGGGRGGRGSGTERPGGNLRDHVGRREGHWGIG